MGTVAEQMLYKVSDSLQCTDTVADHWQDTVFGKKTDAD